MKRNLIKLVCLFLLFSVRATQATELRSTFKDCVDCPEMVMIPAGTFQMGLTDEDGRKEGLSSGEVHFMQPVHTVTVKAFAMGKYPITKAEYALFVADTQYKHSVPCKVLDWERIGSLGGRTLNREDLDWAYPGFEQTDRDPVVCVSWNDAQQYIKWLNDKQIKSGQSGEYRLPTESEWEYAARAGTETIRYWGDDVDHAKQCLYANGRDRGSLNRIGVSPKLAIHILAANCDDGFLATSPVGSFPPNAFGLYDMLGNVDQWVLDGTHFGYKDIVTNELAPTDGSAWLNGYKQSHRFRGGSWVRVSKLITTASRLNSDASAREDDRGFRIAKTIH